MKKIININFQGRVIPIEESAYEILKQYVDSLRVYFANEDGREEIINDIESRIAELFSERLKRGAACITDEDMNAVINSIGRPQDFEAQGAGAESASSTQYQSQSQQQSYRSANTPPPGYDRIGRGRLYRNADDKIIGGVCSGLANYLGIDPVIMRVIFVILFGALFWIYILLWIIVPSQSLQTNITKRLYRNPDEKVIAGVCGGLAAYFNIETWVPRLIFALPLVIGILSGTFHALWWNWDFGFAPRIITGSLSSTLTITYIILWIAVPYATTAAEKLEMRGERVDLNSIRDTVKEDLESFKAKAEKWGHEVKQTAQEFGQRAGQFGKEAGTQARSFAAEAAPAARRASSGIGNVIGILFKAFFLFIAGIIALSLFGVLIGLLFGGMAVFPLKNFILEGATQNMLAWGTLILFLGVPLVGIITWLVRRIMSVRSKNHYLGYTFGGLWVVGWFCLIFLIASLGRNFKVRKPVEDKISLVQPASGKLYIDVANSNLEYYRGDWFGFQFDEGLPISGRDLDTLMLNTVKVKLAKSKDSSFHIVRIRISQGNNSDDAVKHANNIRFDINQQESNILLPAGFPVSSADKFRNQQVLVVIEVPIGKRIELNSAIHKYSWFNVNINNRRGWNIDDSDDSEQTYSWDSGKEYVMTPDGPRESSELDPQELKNGRFKIIIEGDDGKVKAEGEFNNNDDKYHYRYKQLDDSIHRKVEEKLREEMKAKDSVEREKKLKQVLKETKAVNLRNENISLPLTSTHIISPVLLFGTN